MLDNESLLLEQLGIGLPEEWFFLFFTQKPLRKQGFF
jgi:hypothetical protein